MADTFIVTAGKPSIVKDPDAVLDYTLDFTDWLALVTDTIVSHTVVVTGVVKNSSSNTTKLVTMWISGGAVGVTGSAVVRIVTAAGRIDDRTIYFKIKAR